MTLNVGTGTSPSLHQQQTHSQIPEPTSPRRRYSIGSSTSSTFKPGVASSSSIYQATPPQFLPLLSSRQEFTPQPHSLSAEQSRAISQSRKGVSPGRRRHDSKSPERTRGVGGRWQGDGRKSYQQQPAGSKHSTLAMQGRKNELGQSITNQRPSLKYGRSNTSIQSNSLPSTPNHNPSNALSRSPSPPCLLDSPRSAASEPVTVLPFTKSQYGGCIYETALVNARRRMPYSLGIEKLEKEKPRQEKLSLEQDEKLTKDMLHMYEGLKPNKESNERRQKFLEKLARLLNDEWPGHDIQVHAFGSTENHLCMSDSDVDVCITTKWKDLEHVCKLSRALAKRGMERVVCVPGAKVPIVKIWDPEYEVACDMNVNNTLALDNTKMIKTYVEIDDRVRPLAMVIKHWTKQRILNDAAGGGTLSSYTWICMILNFLQTRDPPILPALHQRPHKKRPPISGVDISFDDDIDSLRGFGCNNEETLGGLLFAFFKKYGHELDYERKVISVRQGKLLSKEEKKWQYLQNNRLCVEEPFNTNRNLGNTADDSSVRGLHMEFRRVHKILSEKADLDACCELYESPPEEPHVPLQSYPPPPRPVHISSSTTRGKSRGGFPGRGGRGGHWNKNQNRRTSNERGYANLPLQPQYITPDLFGYIHSSQEQIMALQAQFQAQARAHAQVQLAQAHAQAHHAQMQQSQSQSSSASANSLGSTPNHQDALAALHPFASYAYFAQLCGMNFYYPNQLYPEGLSTPASPHIVSDHRQGLGRGRRQNGYGSGSRSQSQPPPLPEMYITSNYGHGTSTTGVPGSEDEDFDHSSNGNPATPPEEEPDEYVGYYAIGGSLQHIPAVVDSVDEEEEPFLEQKTIVDRQKRLSQERLPPPLLGRSRDTSPLALDRHRFTRDVSGALCLDNPTSRDRFNDGRGPVIVNGSISMSSSSYIDTPPSNLSPPSETLYSYDGSLSGVDPGGSDGTSDIPTMQPKGVSGHPQLFAQKLLEVHNQAAGNRSENDLTASNLARQHTNGCTSTPMSASSLLSSPKSTSQLASDDEVEGIASARLSPGLRQRAATQRAATQQLLWSNTRPPPLDALKSKGHGSLQEDMEPPLPVPEVSTPLLATTKKSSESDLPSKPPKNHRSHGKPRVNNHKKPPVTPAEKSTPKNNVDSKQRNGNTSNSGTKANPNPRSGLKDWEQPKANKTRKNRTPKVGDAVPVNDVERKGG